MGIVSIIIPTYRHHDYVVEALESVFAQTFTDYEVIVVNDGSPDNTAEVLKPYVDSGRIRYIEQKNQGQAAARNQGLSEAKGEFIAFLDDDDAWPPDKLAWQVNLLRACPDASVGYGQVEIMGRGPASRQPGSNAPNGFVFDALATAGWIRSPGQCLIRRRALLNIGGFDATIWGTDDWDLWLRLARAGRFEFRPQLALFYRYHDANASRDFARMHRNGMRVLSKVLGYYPTLCNWHLWWACRRFVKNFTYGDGLREVRRLVDDGQRREAFIAWLNLSRIRPLSLGGRGSVRELVRVVSPKALRAMKTWRRHT